MKRVLAAIIIGSTVGCSGGGSSPAPATPTPVRQLLGQGNFTLVSVRDANAAGFLFDSWRFEITTSASGALEIDADWTFPSSLIAIGLERAPCSFDQFYGGRCADIANVGPPAPKPGRLNVPNLAAGSYVAFIANAGPNAESGNYQVYLTR